MGAAQLLHLEPDVIVVHIGVATRALRRLNKAIPIVMAGVGKAVMSALGQKRKLG